MRYLAIYSVHFPELSFQMVGCHFSSLECISEALQVACYVLKIFSQNFDLKCKAALAFAGRSFSYPTAWFRPEPRR